MKHSSGTKNEKTKCLLKNSRRRNVTNKYFVESFYHSLSKY